MKKYPVLVSAFLLSVFLAACGGGGGGGGSTSAGSGTSGSSSSVAAVSSSSASLSSSVSSFAASSASSPASVTIHMLGDSTMTTYTADRRPQYGWGEKFGQFFNANVTIRNWAAGGRSSRSFYYESGMWNSAKAAINAGDYVIIQFAHNDQKYGTDSTTGPYSTYGTYAICSDPAITDGENCTGGTDVVDTSVTKDEHSYYQFIKRYVTEIQAKGAYPILMTSVVRRYMSAGVVTAEGQHDLSAVTKTGESSPRGNYGAAMKAVATKYGVPLIDVTAGTKSLVESLGSSAVVTPYLFYPDDTHLNGLYATLVARMAIDGMKSKSLLTSFMVSTPAVATGTSALTFSSIYENTTSSQFFNVSGYDLSPAAGTVTLTAPSGFKLSLDQSTWSGSLDISYTGNGFNKTVYVQFAPTAAQTYSGNITIASNGSTLGTVSASGTGLAAVTGTASSGVWAMMNNVLTGTATGLVTTPNAVLGSGITAGSLTNGVINGTTYTGVINRYSATGIAAADATRYIEFSIAPSSGTFTATGISAWLGGSGGSGVYVDILYSTDGFVTSTSLGSKVNPPSNTSSAGYAMTQYAYTGLAIAVPAGKTLSVRYYPYYKDTTSTSKYLSMGNVTIEGAAQ